MYYFAMKKLVTHLSGCYGWVETLHGEPNDAVQYFKNSECNLKATVWQSANSLRVDFEEEDGWRESKYYDLPGSRYQLDPLLLECLIGWTPEGR